METIPNKGIHSDPKSLAAFGPGDARRYNLKKLIIMYNPPHIPIDNQG